MSSFYEGSDPKVDYSGAEQAVETAKAWATKVDGPVDGDNYSALYNADLAQDAANAAAGSAGAAAASAQDAAESAEMLDTLLLGSLVDVANTPPEDTNVLAWSEANQLWEPVPAVIAQQAGINALIAQMTDLRDKLIAAGIIQP